jgi:hypothetical protein
MKRTRPNCAGAAASERSPLVTPAAASPRPGDEVAVRAGRGLRAVGPRSAWGRLRALPAALGCLTLVVVGLLLPTAAPADVPIYAFDTQPSSTQAGAHPDVAFTFVLGNRQIGPQSGTNPCGCNDAKNVAVHLPTGLIGSPSATPQCDVAHFAAEQCPVDSQLGVAEVVLSGQPTNVTFLGADISFLAPVFNLIPPPDQPALFGFKTALADTPVFIQINARTNSDYGVDATVADINHYVPLRFSKTVFWGVPAAPVHDALRFEFGQEVFGDIGGDELLCQEDGSSPSTTDPATMRELCPGPTGGRITVGLEGAVSSNSPETPFFQNPTTCGETSLFTSLDILSYDTGETQAESPYPATTDCALLTFNPSQAIAPTTTAADSPSGAEFRLTVPQFESPSVPSPSELRGAKVTLPEGFSLAPNVTNGKETCSDAQAKFGTTEEAQCPENSKIGTLQVETPVLPGPLPGAVYLGEPKPGNRFRLILAFDGFGVHVKLPGTVTPDPQTGQIRIDFQNLPQAPFANFNMHIFGSERGPLDTPTRCGRYEVSSEWTPWDSALSNQVSRQFFEVNEGPNGTPCPNGPRPFHPGFQAASAASTAGAHTAFSLNLTREDGEQNLSSLKVTTPPGFSATLKGVSYCPEASIAAAGSPLHTGLAEEADPSCPASSLIGEFTTAAGPGTHPLYLPGKVYLAGPYQGAPLSFVFITPAVSGGYDLGNVVIREGLDINPETAQVSTVGAPLPQIFEGIPLRLRQILVNLNRPGFALNPTNCNPFSVSAQVFGSEGAVSDASSHFQVSNCASLNFAPKLALKLSGSAKRAGHPALSATVTYPSAPYANIAKARVSLPHSEFLDQAHIGTVCTRPELAAEQCPAASVYGHAKVETPLLEKPLEGPVYLGTGYGTKLPELIAELNGQIHIILRGKVDTDKEKGIRTTFEAVPDAPVSKFTISLDGGKKGLLENSEDLCAKPQRATADFTGQNGKVDDHKILIASSCGKAKKHKSHKANPNRRAGR